MTLESRPELYLFTRSTPLHRGSGGMESMSWDVAKALTPYAAVVVYTTAIPGRPAQFVHDEVEIRSLRGTRSGRYSVTWWSRTACIAVKLGRAPVFSVSAGATAVVIVRTLLRRNGLSVLQAHGTALAELRAILKSRRIRAWRHVPRLARWVVIDSWVYRRYTTVVAVSDHVADLLKALPYRKCWGRANLEVVVNGVAPVRVGPVERLAARDDYAFGEGRRLVSCVGRADHQKGFDLAIRALQYISDPVDLVIVGDGPEIGRLSRLASTLGLSGRVHLAGGVSRHEARRIIAASDVFAFPSRGGQREGLPMTVLEALSSGVAVVASDTVTWPFDLREQVLPTDVEDSQAFADAISTAVGRQVVLPSRYTLSHAVGRYRNVLNLGGER